uniref:Uncharacterized protein n=1 Tax=Oryzias sinensis TaxID=183150 RepID=A0A8C7ZFR1_9TELE
MREESRLTSLLNNHSRCSKSKSVLETETRGFIPFLHINTECFFCSEGLAAPQKASFPLADPAVKRQTFRPQRRTAESCQSGNSYEREKFRPGPTRDMEAEKRRLQNILAAEKEPTAASPPETPEAENPGAPEERFEEVLHEIEARRQFLADMEALGQEREYISIINTEISQVKSILTKPEPFSVENIINLQL